MIAGIIGGIVAICIALYVILIDKKQVFKIGKKESEKNNQPKSDPDEDDNTVLIHEDDEEETILMKPSGEDATVLPKTVMLRAEDGSVLLNMQCGPEITIGRKVTCDIQIQGDQSVSGMHCALTCDNYGNPVIRDKHSSNGTIVNNEKIIEDRILEDGDMVAIGRTRYIVHVK